MKKAIVRDGIVVNIVELPNFWTGAEGQWQPPPRAQAVDLAPGAAIGGTWDGTAYMPPAAPAPTVYVPKRELWARLSAASQRNVTRFIAANLATDQVADFKGWWDAIEEIDPVDPQWTTALDFMLAQALISQAEKDALSAP